LGIILTASRRETDGFRDNSDLIHNDVSLKLVLDKGDVMDISFYGDYIDREFGRPGVKPPEGTQDYFISGIKVYNSDAASLQDRGSDEDAHLVLQIKSKPLEWLGFFLSGEIIQQWRIITICAILIFLEIYQEAKVWTTNKVRGIEGNMDI